MNWKIDLHVCWYFTMSDSVKRSKLFKKLFGQHFLLFFFLKDCKGIQVKGPAKLTTTQEYRGSQSLAVFALFKTFGQLEGCGTVFSRHYYCTADGMLLQIYCKIECNTEMQSSGAIWLVL